MTEITRQLEYGPVEVRERLPDGTYHRSVFQPGDDLSGLPADVQQDITQHWTPERIAAFEAIRAAPVVSAPPAPAIRTVLQELQDEVDALKLRVSTLEGRR